MGSKVKILGCIVDHKIILIYLASLQETYERLAHPKTVLFQVGLSLGGPRGMENHSLPETLYSQVL